jgi:hypothetical protein
MFGAEHKHTILIRVNPTASCKSVIIRRRKIKDSFAHAALVQFACLAVTRFSGCRELDVITLSPTVLWVID